MSGPNWAEQVTAIATAIGALGLLGALGAAGFAGQQVKKRGKLGNRRLQRTSSADGTKTRSWRCGPARGHLRNKRGAERGVPGLHRIECG